MINIRKSIFQRVKSLIGLKIRKNLSVLGSEIPGRLSDISSIESVNSEKGFDISIKVNSSLLGKLDLGEVYTPGFPKPSLARIRAWASYKGLSDVAVPIWLKIKSKGVSKQYTNWTKNLQDKAKELLK
ncbi:hypothetical protein BPA_0047200 (plasmid) [Borrelia parkeri SLO]|uniref:Uncharacterized protein n=1 Tax=Borrelia parkeri SLO TaxID=1313294 RepID=W5STJ7_BORPR|nr:hypothetical protein [Borrelia parkeri]AHH10013.1 hypothetical protein BPA_0047200 [Borrelia parkeri SLO]UPA11446.1 hypothetical protein bpSLO_001301 [Borrelia parkeri]